MAVIFGLVSIVLCCVMIYNERSNEKLIAITSTIHQMFRPGIERIIVTADGMKVVTRGGGELHPLRDISYNISGDNDNRTVFVVPRRVYYDNRFDSGKPRDLVVILAEVHDDAVDTILACELDGTLSESFRMLKERTSWARRVYPQYVHLTIILQCIGLPQDVIFNGSIARVIYKKKDEIFYSRVTSERPLFLHGGSHDPSTPTKGKGSIVVCTTMYGHPDKFDQWLMYQKYLGVEQVHVNAHPSFSEGATGTYPFLNESLRNGFAQMDAWNPIIGTRAIFHNQFLKYQDCLNRHIGVFEFGLFCDYDDFFNPVITGKKDIHYYFSEFFSADAGFIFSSSVGTACMAWRQMKCGPIKSRVKDVPYGNLTSILSSSQSKMRDEKKCAHRLSAAVMVEIHGVIALLSNYEMVKSSQKLAYMAHNRDSTKECRNTS